MMQPIDFTANAITGPHKFGDPCKVFVIRHSGTIYDPLSFDYELEAADASQRYGQPYEIHWAHPITRHVAIN